ncbi:MAG TPA: hypothetical protein DEP84_23390 [Chloroflexi bacterium]|nr:hypothetical protein [Chloroflexota bacterium]
MGSRLSWCRRRHRLPRLYPPQYCTCLTWAVARLAAARCDAVVLPPLAYTWTGATRPFAGTVSIPADLVIQFVKAICTSLIEGGFRRIVLVSVHGPDSWTLSLAARQIFEEQGVPVAFFNPFPLDARTGQLLGELGAQFARREEEDPGFTEPSLLLAAGEVLRLGELVDLEAKPLAPVPQPPAQQKVKRRGTVGFYYTDPSQHVPKPANPSRELGRQGLEAAAALLAQLIEELAEYRHSLGQA